VAAGGPPPAGTLAAGLPGTGLPGGALSDPLRRAALTPPLSSADYLAQYGHAPVPGAPTFEKPSRGEQIARAILMGLAGAVNPVAGAALLSQHFAEPRLEREAVAEYQRQLPAAQRVADVKAYEDYLTSQRTAADVLQAQTADQRVAQQQRLMLAGEKAKALTDLMNDAAKGVMAPEALRQRGLLLAQANPLLGITAQDIQDVIDKTPAVGAKYKLIWTGPQGLIPHVQDRAGNEYDVQSAPDNDARKMLQMGQNQLNSVLQQQEEKEDRQAQRTLQTLYGPEAIAGAARKSGAEASARTAAELQTGQQMTGTPETQAIAQAIIDGRMKTPSSFALKTPYWQAVMGQVMMQDPGWNEQRAQLRQAYTTGKQSNEINAVNTAMAHVGVLGDAIDALRNGDAVALNRLANAAGVQVGKDNVTTFNTIVNRVGPEIAKAYLGSGGSAGERGTTESDFDSSKSPQQLRSNVSITARLLRSKIAALENPWNQNAPAGANQDFQSRFVMPEAQQALDRWAPLGAAAGGRGNQVFDVSKLKQKYPNASAGQIQDAIERARQQGASIINQ
jgi:hypothetical protein